MFWIGSVWVTLLCLVAGERQRTTVTSQPYAASEVVEISLNKPVKVTPYDATCGHHGNATILHESRTIECVSHCRPRQHPRSLKVDRLITAPGLSFGGSPCKALEVDLVKHRKETNRNEDLPKRVCYLQLNKFVQYEEETYVIQLYTFKNNSQIKGSLLDSGSWRVHLLGSELTVYVNEAERWSREIGLEKGKLLHLAFQVNHALGTISIFLNGTFSPPEIPMKARLKQWPSNSGNIWFGLDLNRGDGQPWLKVDKLLRYHSILTNREIEALYTSKFPQVSPLSQCLCPSHAPAISDKDPIYCEDNLHTRQLLRLPTGLFPADLLTDGNIDTLWVSSPGHNSPISLEVDFGTSVAVFAMNLVSASSSFSGFTVSLFLGNHWADIRHAARDCTELVTGEKSVICETLGSIATRNTGTVEYQIYLPEGHPGSRLRLTIHGRSNSLMESFTQQQLQYHAFGEFQVFARPLANANGTSKTLPRYRRSVNDTATVNDTASENYTDCSECYAQATINCEPDTQGCLCRPGAGIPAKGEDTCRPYIEQGGCIPGFGPEAGGTSLVIAGGYLGRVDAVTFGDTNINFTILRDKEYSEDAKRNFKQRWGVNLSSDTFVHCITPELNTSEYSDVLNVSMPLTIHLANGTVFNTSGKTSFTYKPNPIIDSITPGQTFARGGLNQTITGRYLDSVFASHMTIYANFSGKLIRGTSPFDRDSNLCVPCVCDVQENGTKMVCPTPQFILHTLPVDVGERKLINKFYQNQHFYAEFQMDNVQRYKGPAENRYIWMYKNPVVYAFKRDPNTVHVLCTKDEETLLEIEGEGFTTECGCQRDYYTISLGQEFCEIDLMTHNHITCRPPQKEPAPGNQSRGGHPLLLVTIGNNDLSYHVGYVEYSACNETKFLTGVIAGGISLAIVGLIAAVIAVICIRRKKKMPPWPELPPVSFNNYDSYENILNSLNENIREEVRLCLLEPRSMTLGEKLGEGQFGAVFRGALDLESNPEPQTVAVKTVKDGGRAFFKDVAEFLEEATRMHGFNHENVLALIGVVIDRNIPYIVLPFMENGSLKSYVGDPRNRFAVKDLLGQSYQVSKGMAYLSDQHCIHRDLAARNCMVDKDLIVKVADFGLSRDVYETNYYPMKDKNRALPVKWMALECLETLRFSTKSDVWSFGILMWELFTRCETSPYPDIDRIDMKRYLLSGRRLDCPPACPEEIYDIMMRCWDANPYARPTFKQLVIKQKEILDEPPSRHIQRDYSLPVLNIAATENGWNRAASYSRLDAATNNSWSEAVGGLPHPDAATANGWNQVAGYSRLDAATNNGLETRAVGFAHPDAATANGWNRAASYSHLDAATNNGWNGAVGFTHPDTAVDSFATRSQPFPYDNNFARRPLAPHGVPLHSTIDSGYENQFVSQASIDFY